ncbi:hypothetical protein [Streptomyces cyaneofuscatus]|uniref:hypothetical protein n=1 Tax=Streptomyces cyaneofuscatus TaxID=66883 RepID=UPI0033AABC1E
MTTPTKPGSLAPACRIGEHGECPGPGEVRRLGAPSWERPIEIRSCGCDCHRR